MHQIEYHIEQLQGIAIIYPVGAFDSSNFAALLAVMNKLVSDGSPCIILECRKVAHFGSVELKQLLDFAHYARARGGGVKCVGLSLPVQHVANLVANGDLLECYDEIMVAVAAFRNSRAPASPSATPPAYGV